MSHVVTLIADPAGIALDAAAVEAARAAIVAAGARTGKPDWLAPGIACDIAIETDQADDIEPAARRTLGSAGRGCSAAATAPRATRWRPAGPATRPAPGTR